MVHGNDWRKNNCLYSIKFEDGKEDNWPEAETMKHMEEDRIPMGDVGYKFVYEFCSAPLSGEVIETFDNQSQKCQFFDVENKTYSLEQLHHYWKYRGIPDANDDYDNVRIRSSRSKENDSSSDEDSTEN